MKDHVTAEDAKYEPDAMLLAKEARQESRERTRRLVDAQLDRYYEAERRRLGHYPS